ncbi:hypothetical protein HDU76_012791 [Blyttiomyces sp. JEL0837]|nr:hypothetical protein HDU76_012791 [Blyttiomyces sp. JEL0837]
MKKGLNLLIISVKLDDSQLRNKIKAAGRLHAMRPVTGSTSGVSSGAFLIPKQSTNSLITSLRALGWLKSGTNVTPYHDRNRFPISDIATTVSKRTSQAGTQSEPDLQPIMPLNGELSKEEKELLSNKVADLPEKLSSSIGNSTQAFDQLAVHLNPVGAAIINSWIRGINEGQSIFEVEPLTAPIPAPTKESKYQQKDKIPAIVADSKRKRKRSENDHDRQSEDAMEEKEAEESGVGKKVKENPARFKYIELFAGIGGFRLALDSLGGKSTFASEISESVRETYIANFIENNEDDETMLIGDITEIEGTDVPDHDILTAGFPCQSFCKVGDRTGLDDERGELFFEVVRILAEKRPKAFLLENVANLVTLDNGSAFETIISHLKKLNYQLSLIIDAAHYVPQTRLRIYIVGFLSETHHQNFTWPSFPPRSRTLRSILDTTISIDSPLTLTPTQVESIRGSRTYRRNPLWRIARCDGRARTLMGSYRVAYRMYSEVVPVPLPEEGQGLKNEPSAAEKEYERELGEAAVKDINNEEEGNDYAEVESAESVAEVDRVVEDASSNPAVPDARNAIDNGHARFYSPRECARIMGFPESFIIDKSRFPNTFYHQIGNAVCPPVIQAVTDRILAALEI